LTPKEDEMRYAVVSRKAGEMMNWLRQLRRPLTPDEQADYDLMKAELKAFGDSRTEQARGKRQAAKTLLSNAPQKREAAKTLFRPFKP
jgi:hypothetical protein